MKLLSRFRKSPPPPPPSIDEPGPLPPIIDRPLRWSAPFKPLMLSASGSQVAALPLLDATEIALCPFANPQNTTAECAHMGLRVILLTLSSNLRDAQLPSNDDARSAAIKRVLTSPIDVDRWNTGLLFLHRRPDTIGMGADRPHRHRNPPRLSRHRSCRD